MKFILISLICLFILPIQARDLPSYSKLSNLVNPHKLASLKKGNRSGNARFKKLMYWINIYEAKGVKPKAFLKNLYNEFKEIKPYNSKLHVYAPLTEQWNLEAQYRLGRVYGLYTPENLLRLKKGNAPIVTKGKYIGQKIEIDHLIPYSKAPELENSMANLTWLPKTLNRSKGAKITNSALRREKALFKEVGWVWDNK